MLAIAFGIGSSVCWGLSDFLGGVQSRSRPLLSVLFVSQAVGLAGIALFVALFAGAAPPLGDLWPAAAGGAAGLVGLAAFYRALAIGTMSVVAPISATGAAVPVLVGVAGGDRPGALRVAGMVAALIGVVLASRELGEGKDTPARARLSIVLALAAALGFGSFFVGLKEAAHASVPWALLAARGVDVILLAPVAIALRESVRVARSVLPLLALIGLLDLGANGLFALATNRGLLSVVAVLASLYPVVTVVLARLTLGERIRRVQGAGVATVMVGVALIAAG
ncbi:MAG: hypothetical protein QOJ68_3311 [Blastococcus sp.]|nr:hypothetical protein [Blastococcus sp.]